MKNLIKIQITEKDNMLTAISKGMVEGALTGAVFTLGLAGVVYALGKAVKDEEIEIEFEGDEEEA